MECSLSKDVLITATECAFFIMRVICMHTLSQLEDYTSIHCLIKGLKPWLHSPDVERLGTKLIHSD